MIKKRRSIKACQSLSVRLIMFKDLEITLLERVNLAKLSRISLLSCPIAMVCCVLIICRFLGNTLEEASQESV